MLFANFFNLFVSQHTTGLLLVFLATFCCSLACSRGRVFPFILLNLEDGATSSVLSEHIRASIAACAKSGCRSFIWLRLDELVPICQRLLPAFRVLAASKGTNTVNLADLLINLLDVGVTLQLFNGLQEWDLSHNHNLLKEHIDEAFFKILVVISLVFFHQSHRFDQVNWVFLSLQENVTERLKKDFRAWDLRLNLALLDNL